MKKLINVSLLLISVSISFSQSKKQQIETLTIKLDSVNSVLLRSIDDNEKLSNTKLVLESKISLLKKENDSLKKENFNSKELQNKLKEENQNQLEKLSKNEELINQKESVIRLLNDSINILHEIIENTKKENKAEYYIIEDPDGYSNLREIPGGTIIRQVYSGDKFEIIGEKKDHKKVKFSDSSTGFIHKSRVVKFNDKICECLQAADKIIKKDLDKDFSLGSKTGFPENWNPTYEERLVKIFQYQSPMGCDFLADPSWIGIDIESEIQRCSE